MVSRKRGKYDGKELVAEHRGEGKTGILTFFWDLKKESLAVVPTKWSKVRMQPCQWTSSESSYGGRLTCTAFSLWVSKPFSQEEGWYNA